MARRQPGRAQELAGPHIALRRSARLVQPQEPTQQEPPRRHQQLPSPTPSYSPPTKSLARKRRLETVSAEKAGRGRKRIRTAENRTDHSPSLSPRDPVAYWAATFKWPKSEMSKPDTTSAPGSKRRGSSTHPSEKRKRLEENGIYMKASVLLKEESKRFCEELLDGHHEPYLFPCYPASRLEVVLERVHELNEARLQRDIMPWIVPSAENLHFSGVIDCNYIGEEVDTEWSRCETMGSSRPKPDFTAGLKRSAFSAEEGAKLQNYGTAQRPYLFTPDLAFPFLMCEAKTGRVGLDNADTQNIHSASIATRAILSLYVSTFGSDHESTKDLFGRILVFTVSHNNRVVNLYGHYAVRNSTEDGDSFTYFRHDIAMFSLTLYGGRERFKAYTFIRKLYERFASQHLERIRTAVQSMPKPAPCTGLSFAASDIALEERGSQPNSRPASQGDEAFRVPSEPASASQSRELAKMREQLDRLLQQTEEEKKESRRREEALKQQTEQEKEESRRREGAFKQQTEQEKEESRRREEAFQQQMEQQQQEHRRREETFQQQMEQQQEESKKREEALERRLDQMMEIISRSAK